MCDLKILKRKPFQFRGNMNQNFSHMFGYSWSRQLVAAPVLHQQADPAAATAAAAEEQEVVPLAEAEASATSCGKLFKNAFLVHGVKHICDNAMQDILQSLKLSLGCSAVMMLWLWFCYDFICRTQFNNYLFQSGISKFSSFCWPNSSLSPQTSAFFFSQVATVDCWPQMFGEAIEAEVAPWEVRCCMRWTDWGCCRASFTIWELLTKTCRFEVAGDYRVLQSRNSCWNCG